jgi:RNA polymerase sigma-70 factor (ECF subfamily)
MARLLDHIAVAPTRRTDAAVEVGVTAEEADRSAVARACAGHPEAFGEVVRRHNGAVHTLCSRMLHDGRLGEDLTQDTFAKAFSHLDTFRGQSTVRHWLYRIAANGCRDQLRAGRERTASLDDEEPWTGRDPEREAVARQTLEALSGAVASLPPACRQAFVLFHMEDLSYEQISALTGVGVGALKVRVHRARELLRRRLGEVMEVAGAGLR